MEKRQTQIRLPAFLYEEIKRLAQTSNRSLNGQLVELVQRGIDLGKQDSKQQKPA